MLPKRHPAIVRSEDACHHFGENGYRTGYIGKWHLYDRGIEGAVPESARAGYEYWLASNVLEFTSDAYHTVLYDNDNNAVKLPGYRVDAVTDAMIRYIDAHQGDPFYLSPHISNLITRITSTIIRRQMAIVSVTRGDGFRQISLRWEAQRISISPAITVWSNA